MNENESVAEWSYPVPLFGGFGIEIEFMIVDRESLDVMPVADALFASAAGAAVSEHLPDGEDGAMAWSNELALHVAEIKCNGVPPRLEGLAAHFQDSVARIDSLLAPLGARLLPGGMHPWMDSTTETRLWPHENNEIYRAYDRIFGCRGHGWGNLQSTHINLPFANDEEFGRLHAAIRPVLPLIPALAASSPFADGVRSAVRDHRLEVYRNNARRIPLMTGRVVPEAVFTRADYEREILGRLYDELVPHDPQGILREEWANSRGCIARFDRGAIEIRIVDSQESPRADLAVVALIVAAVKAFTREEWIDTATLRALDTEQLHGVLLEVIRDAENAEVRSPALLRAFGLEGPRTAGAIWRSLLDRLAPELEEFSPDLEALLKAGSLSTRLLQAAGASPSRDTLRGVYRDLADCLAEGALFHVGR